MGAAIDLTVFSCRKLCYIEMEPSESPSESPPDEEKWVFVPSRSYATRKTIAKGALDFALLMSNASQLKAVIDLPSNNRGRFYEAQLVMISLSILLQVVVGFVLLILGFSNPKDEKGGRRTENLNNASVCLILLITVINVFISAFGISYISDPCP